MDDLSLFGDDDDRVEATAPQVRETPIADWQVGLLRKALDSRGLIDMAERQQAIEEVVGRRVDSLRALTHGEGMAILTRLGAGAALRTRTTSQWDDRDEETWIDRL